MLKRIISGTCLVLLCLAGGLFFLQKSKSVSNNHLKLTTEYGDFDITEPVLIDLINDKFVQRLKNIRQYGVNYYTVKNPDYNRYDHSVGVFLLLRKYGASLNEQIAGLLHDVSHTVFSHVGDWMFKTSHLGNDSYQDTIHEEFINKTTIPALLKKHNISVSDILHKSEAFVLLEQQYPDICADRLEFNLKGGFIEDLLTQNDIDLILNNLIFENGKWIFIDISSAKKFAKVPLVLMQKSWSSKEEFVINEWIAQAMQRAVEIKELTLDEISFSIDDLVWNKLLASKDKTIQTLMNKSIHYKDYIKCVKQDDYDFLAKNKFRGIDPLIKTENGLVRLTELDKGFKTEFNEVKQCMESGWRLKFAGVESFAC